ncbi:uncharacterized protein LOC124155182 [Ischnura elegans]|uniref:uncharacterized protein LOC124155182 n=1 Tax=Ischnura elegans TaxID=197161 RepID=UPI001ED8AECF|nr:uncharacterized protein LOC124155182 [Ischnura elegans]
MPPPLQSPGEVSDSIHTPSPPPVAFSSETITQGGRNVGPQTPLAADSNAEASGDDSTAGKANDSSAQASESGRSFPVGRKGRHPSNILGKPSGEGHWATPAPHSGIVLPFVPLKLYSQVRHTYEVNHRPRSDAIASASSPEELAAAARLRESIQTKKISEVYSEEGYEDSAYDHAGFAKDAGFKEGHEGHEGGKKKKGHSEASGADEDDGPSGAASTSEDQKYPFHKIPPSDAVPRLSPLRYALNPASGAIPSKTAGGTEFYDSTDSVECPTVVELPSIPGREFRRPAEDEDGESSEKKEVEDGEPKLAPTPAPPPTPRLKGLGDKIDCLRTKFFGGEEPLDNPFFKEQVVSVAKNEIRKAKAEQSRIQEEIDKDRGVKAEESKIKETVDKEGKNGTEKQTYKRRQKSNKGYAAGFERYDPPANKSEKLNATDSAVEETAGQDRMGEAAEDQATSGVGAAVEGLPSAAASDSDMQGFYADIMGHIQSATGNIVRQAYSGRNNNGGDRSRRIRPPKAPRPPIIGFLDEREPFPASVYPSVLPPPNNFDESANRYSEADEAEEDEEYAGSEREEAEEEEEDDHQHHNHHHPPTNIFGGAQRVILRPINPQSQRYNNGGSGGGGGGGDVPFRPSPLLYVQNHPVPQRAPVHSHSTHQSSGDSYMHHHHHHHPHSGEPHSHRHHHHSTGIRTFLVPAGSRPVPLSPPPMGQHYHVNSISGLRGSGTLLIPKPSRYTSTTPAYPGISLYPSRSPYPSLKRQSPVGQEFDGLLTATTQSVMTLAAPNTFRKYRGQQSMADMVASSSSVSHAFSPPRNIEYFTLKDSLPHTKTSSIPSKLLPPESETLIPQITFTTTEKYSNPEKYHASANAAPSSPGRDDSVSAEVSHADDSVNVERVTEEYPSGEFESTENIQSIRSRSTVTSDATLQAPLLSTAATKLVTEEVARGVVRAAIEEGTRKRRKNLRVIKVHDSFAPESIGTTTQRPRNKRRRKNRVLTQNTNTEEGKHIDMQAESDSTRGDKKSQQVSLVEETGEAETRTVTSHRERLRKGDRGASRIRVGLTDTNGRNQGVRGRRRGEPRYNTSNDDTRTDTKVADVSSDHEDTTKNDRTKRSTTDEKQKIQRRNNINLRGGLPQQYSEETADKDREAGFHEGSPAHQSNPQTERPLQEAIAPVQVDKGNIQNPSAQIEEPRKMFVEPRIRGDGKKVQIPPKVVTRSRTHHRIRVSTDNSDEITSRGSESPGGRRSNIGSVSLDPTGKRWEVGKRRTISSLERGREERIRGNPKETRETTRNGSTSNRSTTQQDNRNNAHSPRVMRHREIKETLTSVYAPEE